MNCDCIGTVEKKMADFMRDRAGDDAEARIKNTTFAFEPADDNQSEKLVLALMIPLRVKVLAALAGAYVLLKGRGASAPMNGIAPGEYYGPSSMPGSSGVGCSKKGYTSERGKDVPCRASHCPFCGRTTGRYVVGADAGIAAAMQIQ